MKKREAMNRLTAAAIGFVVLLSIRGVYAHVPQGSSDNTSLEAARHVDDPTKSWVFYDGITQQGQVRYYFLHMKAGQRIRVSLFTPKEDAFTPGFAIMGMPLDALGAVPSHLEVPDSYNVRMYPGKGGEAKYEPFTPGAYYYTAETDITVPVDGTYYIAVLANGGTGPFGLAVGYEERYSLIEWVRVATDAVRIHLWEGKSLIEIFYPYILAAVGALFLAWRRKGQLGSTVSVFGAVTLIVSALYVGSGLTILHHCTTSVARAGVEPTIAITLIFAALPILIGRAVYRLGWAHPTSIIGREQRLRMALYSGLGIVVWAGLIVGPLIAFGGSLAPRAVLEMPLTS
jgi:hypothetical protein